MAEYIDRQATISKIREEGVYGSGYSNEEREDNVVDMIASIPAADVRPVVTCAECDWHVDCGYHFCNKWCLPCPDNADFYCAYGERPTAAQT